MHDLPIAAMSLASRPEDQDRNLMKQKPRGEADNGHWITPLLLVLCNSRYAAAGSPPSLCVCFGRCSQCTECFAFHPRPPE